LITKVDIMNVLVLAANEDAGRILVSYRPLTMMLKEPSPVGRWRRFAAEPLMSLQVVYYRYLLCWGAERFSRSTARASSST